MLELKRRRKDKGLSSAALAAVIGITRAAYTNIENGKRQPSVAVAKRIAAVLGFDWTRFFEEEAEEARGA